VNKEHFIAKAKQCLLSLLSSTDAYDSRNFKQKGKWDNTLVICSSIACFSVDFTMC